MPLDANGLQQALRDLFNGVGSYPATVADAGTRWATIYATYAKTAHAGPTAPVAATADTQAGILGSALAGAFTAAQAAGTEYLTVIVPQMATRFTGFWPLVGFLAPGVVGIATSPPPAALTTSLIGFFGAGNAASGPRPSGDAQADRMASLLDGWTRTVSVINTAGGVAQPPVFLT